MHGISLMYMRVRYKYICLMCRSLREAMLIVLLALTHQWVNNILVAHAGVGGAVRFLVVGTIGQEERPPRGQLWMEQCLTSLKYWPILYTIWADPNYTWGLAILADSLLFRSITFWRAYGLIVFPLLKLLSFFRLTYYCSIGLCFSVRV